MYDSGNFDSYTNQSAIMVFNLLNVLIDKIGEFLLATLAYCVNDNRSILSRQFFHTVYKLTRSVSTKYGRREISVTNGFRTVETDTERTPPPGSNKEEFIPSLRNYELCVTSM